MIAGLPNQKGGGRTTLTLHLACPWAGQGKRITIIDADARGSALDWSGLRVKEAAPRFIDVIGHAHDTLRREEPALAYQSNDVVVDCPLRVALLRWALLAPHLTLILFRSSSFDRWVSAEMMKLLWEARISRPQIAARFVLNRYATCTMIAWATADRLADHDPPAVTSRIDQRAALADAARSGRLILDIHATSRAAREIVPMTAEVERAVP